jgi:hypothetical protein
MAAGGNVEIYQGADLEWRWRRRVLEADGGETTPRPGDDA